ncbi:hypothetical protein BDV34DRAFT_220732 [Aspergillus parasiticus]|uniref:DNA2/NAM7 helicase helicase domain-containing protein n=1 Tax=Aspergillus parasiticus TaxID=5067 RepID=A0A5N6DYP4_ASPPA|nr:hypothetical protein BDV34DRAFT_220732 [Aspergillus parasiticus]
MSISLHRKVEGLPPEATEYLQRMKGRVDLEQYGAIQAAPSMGATFQELVTLITGPPGTGETSVSTRIAIYHCHTKRPLLIVYGSNQGLDVIANRIMLRLSYPNDPHGSDEIYGLDTDYQEELETQLAPGAKAASDTEFMAKLRPDLGRLGISDEEFNLLRSSIEGFMKSQGNPSLGGHIIKPLEHAKCLGSSRLEGEDEMILLWTFLTYQETPVREGFLLLEDAVEDAVEDPGAMARPGEALVSDDNSVSMVATLITRRKEAWRELQRYYMHRARLALHCLHNWPQGAPVASPLQGNNRGGFLAHGTNSD